MASNSIFIKSVFLIGTVLVYPLFASSLTASNSQEEQIILLGVQRALGNSRYQGVDYNQIKQENEKSAAQGHANAQYTLGLLYHNGVGVTQNYIQAREWYEKAAAQGHANAQYTLGLLYHSGAGVTQNYIQAREWYEKAAAQENESAQFHLGFIYHNGIGVNQDYVQARKWYEKAACQGNGYSQYSLGSLYHEGLGISKDDVQAKQWFLKSANQDNPTAQNILGCILEEQGDFVNAKLNYEKSISNYEKLTLQTNEVNFPRLNLAFLLENHPELSQRSKEDTSIFISQLRDEGRESFENWRKIRGLED